MFKKIVVMCVAALLACAGAVADDGSDSVVLTPGGWTTDLTVNGKKVWSRYNQPKGAGWNCVYDSKAKCFKLSLSSVTEYTLGGELTGRVMDKNGNVTKIEVGTVSIDQTSTVTLDNLSVTAGAGSVPLSIKDGKSVTLKLKGENKIVQASDEVIEYTTGAKRRKWLAWAIPSKALVTIDGGESDKLYVKGNCAAQGGDGLFETAGKSLVVNGGQVEFGNWIVVNDLVVNNGRMTAASACVKNELTVNNGNLTSKYIEIQQSANLKGGTCDFNDCEYLKDCSVAATLKVGKLVGETLNVLPGAAIRVDVGIDSQKFDMTGGKIEFSVEKSKLIADDMFDMSAGLITGRPSIWMGFLARLTMNGGEIQAYRFYGYADGESQDIYMHGGRMTFSDKVVLNYYCQAGGCFIVEGGGSFSAKTVNLYDGTFLCGSGGVAANVAFEWFGFYGGSWYPGELDPLACGLIETTGGHVYSSLSAFSEDWYLLPFDGLPKNSKIEVHLGFSYGVDEIWTDNNGCVYLLYPNLPYSSSFEINGTFYGFTWYTDSHGVKDWKLDVFEKAKYTVTYRTNQGMLHDDKNDAFTDSVSFKYEAGDTPMVKSAEELQMSCKGKRFSHWENLQESQEKTLPGKTLTPLNENIVLLASWTEDIVADAAGEFDVTFVYNDSTGKHQQTVRQTVGRNYVLPANPSWPGYRFVGWFTSEEGGSQILSGTLADESVKTVHAQYFSYAAYFAKNDNFANAINIGDATGMIANPPVDYSTYQAAGEPFMKSSVIDVTSGTLWYRWTAPMTGTVTFTVDRHGTSTDLAVGVYTGETLAGLSAVDEKMFTSDDVRLSFDCEAGRPYYVCIGCDGTYISADLCWNVVSEAESKLRTWTMNRYGYAELMDLGIEVPSADLKGVKAEGLPKGLKLVQDKAKTAWYIEGVATEPLDYEKKFATIRLALRA